MKPTSKNELARKLGGEVNGQWINMPGPGHSSSDRSLGMLLDPKAPDGFRLHSFADDDPAVCRTYVKARLAKIDAAGAPIVKASVDTDQAMCAMRSARRIWNESAPLKGTLGHKYLHSRGCGALPEDVSAHALRFHPLCPFGSDRYPALIAAMCDIATGEIVGIQRIAISDDGHGKRVMPDGSSKRMIGSSVGAAVPLHGLNGGHLGIAEGIETALSAAMIFKMPVWSVLSASGIKAFPVIHGIKFLRVCADYDKAGISAGRECKRRYEKAGIGVEVRYPPGLGTDWNDYLRKESV
jgi:hypothetical protein